MKKRMTKADKLKLIYDMSFDGKSKATIAKKLGIRADTFYKNKEYNDRFMLGESQGVIANDNIFLDAYRKRDTKHGMSTAAIISELHGTKLDDFTLTKADLKDIPSIKKAISKVILAQVEVTITPTRAKQLLSSLESAIAAHRAGAEHKKNKFIAEKLGIDIDE